jgi:D-glycero-D-manno-heptose 1,7-bisphosphate phosphatase
LVILGRDGILNHYRDDHVKAPDEWVPIEGALQAVARLNHAGWHAVVATNQAGIGRGMIDMASINAIHAHMMQRVQQAGGRLDAVFFCPHAPQEACECRKPAPGMMFDICRRYGLSTSDVHLVADTLRDLLAAQAAGCQPHLVLSGRAAQLDPAQLDDWQRQVPRTRVHTDLGALADHLLQGARATAAPIGS